MINQLDDIDKKLSSISEQNIAIVLLQLKEKDFENDLLGCYHRASEL